MRRINERVLKNNNEESTDVKSGIFLDFVYLLFMHSKALDVMSVLLQFFLMLYLLFMSISII